ncbi:hypothetical protein CPB86DRAFT_683400, partial [Serendipita vermifera]
LPPELALHILFSSVFLTFSTFGAKYWLLARGVGSLWLSINVLAGGGLGAIVYLVIRGRVAVRGELPWRALGVAALSMFAKQIALFYSLKRLEASRVLFLAPFSTYIIDHIIRTHSKRSITLALI